MITRKLLVKSFRDFFVFKSNFQLLLIDLSTLSQVYLHKTSGLNLPFQGKGLPMIIPTVKEKHDDYGPRFSIPLRSMLKQSSTSWLEVTP